MQTFIEILEKVGTPLVILAGLLFFAYRVLGKVTEKGGYMDVWMASNLEAKRAHIESQKLHAEANDRHSRAAERMAASYEFAQEQLARINEEAVANRLHHHDPNSSFSTVTIHRCLRHSMNILEQYADDHEIQNWGEHIEAIRDELKRVEAIQDEQTRKE
jgi:hypothetical protein